MRALARSPAEAPASEGDRSPARSSDARCCDYAATGLRVSVCSIKRRASPRCGPDTPRADSFRSSLEMEARGLEGYNCTRAVVSALAYRAALRHEVKSADDFRKV